MEEFKDSNERKEIVDIVTNSPNLAETDEPSATIPEDTFGQTVFPIPNVSEEETYQEKAEETSAFSQSFLNTPPNTKKKGVSSRIIMEIIGGVLLLIFILFSTTRVSKSEYNMLEKKLENTESELETATRNLNATTENLDSITKQLDELAEEYNVYREKMSAYEQLADAEAEARKIEADKVLAEQKAEEERVTAEKEAQEKAEASATLEQKNALSTAKSYLDFTAFSYSGLIEQLEFEGYSNEAATYAVDNCGADWNEQAAKMAQSYMDYMSFSRSGLIEQLIYEGFSNEQAEYGVSSIGY